MDIRTDRLVQGDMSGPVVSTGTRTEQPTAFTALLSHIDVALT